MKNEIIAESCRICLTKTKKLRSLYKAMDEGDEPPNIMLLLITGIKVEKLEEYEMLPKNICKNCELSLSMAFEFRDNALKTEQIILEYINELNENENIEETVYKNNFEDVMNIEPLDCEVSQEDLKNLSNDQNNYASENDEEESNDNEKGENYFEEKDNPSGDENYNQSETYFHISKNEGQAEAESSANHNYFEQQDSTDDEQDIKQESRTSDEQEELEYTQEQVEIIPAEEEETYTIGQKDFTGEISSKKPKRKKISSLITKDNGTQNDIIYAQHMKLIPRRGRRPAKSTDQNGHICDICGNVFSKRGRMMEHRQRHDKECRFCCEICDKKFLTRELLRKHMFSHSGGKPLKCEFCSRTFYYESVRKAHEAVHKGLRPYICDVCGKGFSYAHALKKHKLIHAEIKLYRCEYCHKDFRLQHHMKQHELTKLHQNAVRFAKGVNISYEDCDGLKEDQELDENILYIEEIADDNLVVSSL